MESVMLNEIHKDVEDIKRQLNYLSTILVEKMTSEDIKDLEQAQKEYLEGKTKTIDEL